MIEIALGIRKYMLSGSLGSTPVILRELVVQML